MTTLPYLTSPGALSKALNAIQNAAVPEKVSQDFVKTVLQIRGGSGDNMTTFLRRVGFAASDGTPTDIYRKFRNLETAGSAAADAVKLGYSEIFRRNTYAYRLSEKELRGMIVEITGAASDARSVTLTLSTIKNFFEWAEFDGIPIEMSETSKVTPSSRSEKDEREREQWAPQNSARSAQPVGLNLGYTINLNLPATSDINVFNAIFKSLKENLLISND